MRRSLISSLLAFFLVFSAYIPVQSEDSGYGELEKLAVALYEDLADALLALKRAETQLVNLLIKNYGLNAQLHLERAKGHIAAGEAAKATKALESAAQEVGKIANEGGKDVEGIKQRLSKGGHHHISSVDKEEGYIVVGKEAKRDLLDIAREIGKLAKRAESAKPVDVEKISERLSQRMAYLEK